MTEMPIPKLIMKLAIPSMVSMLITAFYNTVDTFFVGQIGTSATGAVGVSFALMGVIQAFGFTFGQGGGNYISRLLGSQDNEQGERVAATAFFTAFGAGILILLFGQLFLDQLVYALGATPTIAPHARDYLFYILLGAPFMTATYVLNNLLRFQGNSFFGMIGILTGAILNIGLDPLFIFVFDMGVGGAALATAISQFVSFCVLLYQTNVVSPIKVKLRNFRPTPHMYREIIRIGIPSFFRQILMSVAVMGLNFNARVYGDAAVAAMSIVGRVFQFVFSALLGFGQGYQPVCGFNYGAGRYGRVLEGRSFCIKASLGFLAAASALMFVFAPSLVAIFRRDDQMVIEIGALAMRLQCLTIWLSPFVIMNNMLFQNIGRSKAATITAIARQGLFFLPAIFILPKFFGLLGVQMAQTVADVFTLILIIPLSKKIVNELKNMEKLQQESTEM